MEKQRHSLIPSVFLVFRKGDSVLLVRRFNTGYSDGLLTPPAGHVEAGEKFTRAAIREAREEVGIYLEEEDLQLLHVVQRKVGTNTDRIDVYFLVDRWEGEVCNNEPHKCSELVWVPLANFPEDIIYACRHSIDLGMRGIFFSELWE